ncbi:hda-6 [Symbiodinium sp. CCMP2592]|nr:hda-6 [Symbiodinium sp. CCMP2592]
MSVHPADGANTGGARAPEPPLVKKAWTQPDPSPAAPHDEPPALGVEEHTAPLNQKPKRRASLTALLPHASPVTSSVQHHRSGASVGTLSWNLLLPLTPKSSGRTSSSSQDLPEACHGGLSRKCSVSHPAVLGAQNHDDDSQQDVATVVSVAVRPDLVDVNLIIIGSCGEAVELLRRRRREGGRALLLWTNRPQQACIKDKPLNGNLRSAKLNMDSFVWNPAPASDPASPVVHRMRRQYGCAAVGMSRFGPDILDLRDVECYRVKVDDSGCECGIEVYNEMRGNLLWAMSGAVVFCGPSYRGHGQAVCSSMAEVKSLDVSVGFQEAMPLATTTTTSVVIALLQNFVFLTAYFVIMKYFEATADSKHWPWWRLSWVLGPGLATGAVIYPRYWGMTLFGHHPPVWFCGLGAVVISLAYVQMQMSSPQAAALFLAVSTSVTEKVVCRILNASYTTFIYTPRSSVNGSKSILGDQRRYLTVPVAMTHAYCEAVRLSSLLSVTVRSPSWAWLPSVLLNVSFNLMERTQLMMSLAVRILPWCDWMFPGLSLVIMHDVRLHAGYAQHVAVLALLVAEIVSGGLGLTSVLNKQCVILIFCCLILEILEDVLVHVLPRSDYWRRRLSPYYEQQPVLHPKQLLLMVHQGTNYEAAPLAPHGQRSLALGEVVALMWPSCLFTYFLMTLLLGAGYVHGVCDEPMPKEFRALDALIWESPLLCV